MIDIQQLKQNIDLTRMVDTSLLSKPLRGGEHIGPCPKCGGVDRFSIWADRFFCRQCKPPTRGRKYDAIEFSQWYYGDSFKDAIARLGGPASERIPIAATATLESPKAKDFDHGKAEAMADDYHKQLMSGLERYNDAYTYLYKRMITPTTMAAFGVGVSSLVSLPGTWDRDNKRHIYPKQSAITLPWFDRGGACVGIRYRFLESHTYTDVKGGERTAKKSSLYNSTFSGGYGWHTLKDNAKYLVIIEGEINAMSVWQSRPDVDVISVGGETSFNSLSDSMKSFIAKYGRVLVWADKQDVADNAALAIGADCYVDPHGKDANDRLMLGNQLKRILDCIFPDVQSTTRQPLPTNLWRRFDGEEAAADAWRYYESVAGDYKAHYYAKDGIGIVTGEKAEYSIQADYRLSQGKLSAALSAAITTFENGVNETGL